jgi:hypothetical protein
MGWTRWQKPPNLEEFKRKFGYIFVFHHFIYIEWIGFNMNNIPLLFNQEIYH